MKTCAKHAGEKNVKHKEKKPLASHEWEKTEELFAKNVREIDETHG